MEVVDGVVIGLHASRHYSQYKFRTRNIEDLVRFLEHVEDNENPVLDISGVVTVGWPVDYKTPEEEMEEYREALIGDEGECFV